MGHLDSAPQGLQVAEQQNKDVSQLGIKFTLNKRISEFIHALEKLNLDYITSFAMFGNAILGRYQTN